MPNDAADDARTHAATNAATNARGQRLAVVAVVAVVLCDQLSKAWAVATLADGPVSIIGTTIELRLGRNAGGAFSLFGDYGVMLAILAAVMVVVLVRMVRRTEGLWMIGALALVLGGALGNLSDRVFRSPGFLRGAVVDFVSVGSFPTFNVADSALTVGAIVILVTGLFGGRGAGAPRDASS